MASLCCLSLPLTAADEKILASEIVQDSYAQATGAGQKALAEAIVQDSLNQASNKREEAVALIEGHLHQENASFFGLEEKQETSQERVVQEGVGETPEHEQKEVSPSVSPNLAFSASPQKTCSMGNPSFLGEEPPQKGEADFLVFVSFSMSDQALRDLSHAMKYFGGRLVITGLLNNAFQATRQKILDLGIEADIDPTLFETYGIKRVPTYVLTRKSDAKTFDQLAGHISPQAALEIFKEKGSLSCLAASLLLSRRGSGE